MPFAPTAAAPTAPAAAAAGTRARWASTACLECASATTPRARAAARAPAPASRAPRRAPAESMAACAWAAPARCSAVRAASVTELRVRESGTGLLVLELEPGGEALGRVEG